MSAPDDTPSASINMDVRIQPGPDGSPWECLNITHGIMGATIVVPPGTLAQVAKQLPAMVADAMDKAIDADNAQIKKALEVIPAGAMDQLPNFEITRNMNRAARRHPPRN